ncbi:MAG TPA: TonB-dependent receptor [Blastocatellia bacterium]|nr:TonB-dependent receptor [Blastocatellia bacterium]HMX24912.1 TonB-dependent receptor [Blastocatellia bacterium]HMY71702.1 TonB-dependent receptor [Blastocatellia bacterium]HMZ18132.1 TonB-dependent receptor [Blastocatellia bacterium]HNG30205.1 TonB-dependent receptor [Blastocatellia bacterium]
MLRTIFLFLTSLTLGVPAFGQATATLKGRVTDLEGKSLSGISARIEGTNLNADTNSDGEFSLPDLAAGSYALVISGGGYVPQQRTVEIKEGQTQTLEFRLERVRASVDVVADLAEYRVEEMTTATRTSTRLIDLPQSVQVFPNQLIEDRAITEGNDLFRNVSGINQNTYSAMTFRGFTQREILYNGARGNPFGSLDGDVANSGFSTSQIRLTNIQRVEVLKGPVSALYGAGEAGGLINYVTKKPKEVTDGEVQFRFGNFGQKYVSGELTGPATDKLLYRGAIYFEDRESFRRFANLDRRPEARNYNAVGNLLWRPRERHRFGIEYEFIKQELPGQRLRGVPVDAAGNFLTNIEWTATEPTDFIKLDAHVFQFRGDHELGRDWSANYTFRYLDYDRAENYHEPRGLNAATATGRTMRREFRDQFRSNQDWSFVGNIVKTANTGGVIHNLLFGAEYAAQDHLFRSGRVREREVAGGVVPALDLFNPVYGLTSQRNYNITSFATDTADTGRAGFYMQDQIVFSRYFQMLAGGRIDRYNDEGFSGVALKGDGTFASGRVGAVVKPIEQLSFYASVANSFIRPPVLSQAPSANGPHDPETGVQFEAGAKAELLNRKLFLSTAFFNINKENVLRPDPNFGPTGNNVNAVLATGAARSRGVEFNVEGFFTRAWYVAFNYAFVNTRITKDPTAALIGQPLANAPRHTTGLFTRYNFTERTGIGLGVEQVSDRVEPFAGIRADGYAILDLSFYQQLTKPARLQLQITNVTNERYAMSSLFAARAGNFPGQPRAFVVTLALTPFRNR